jgi:gas vesicle protein
MRTIKTLTGEAITLDNDLLAVLETLFQEVTVKKELARTYEDMMREIQHVVSQLSEDERREYLIESLFLNTVTYENERLGAVLKKLPLDEPDARA